tara:strand:- start:1371 stop:1508 length:138 start_codon:yes stop_codon:yes gene_type:complete
VSKLVERPSSIAFELERKLSSMADEAIEEELSIKLFRTGIPSSFC